MSNEYVLQMLNISKEFYGNRVLRNVSLKVRPGEILSLVGENGAGKSTLMNVLFGMPHIRSTGGFEGKILIEGQEASIKAPEDAIHYGIGMVHQEFMLLPNFTIAENIKLNRENLKPTVLTKVFGRRMSNLDRKAMRSDARKSLDKIGLNMSENDLLAGLPVGYMQFVEIAREIDKSGMKLIVFDEPTAVLTEVESKRFLAIVKKIATDGVAVIFITHKLDEVMDISDTIMVMRDGEGIQYLRKEDTNTHQLAQLMVGRGVDVDSVAKARDLSGNGNIMTIKHLSVEMPGEKVKDFSLDIRKGEIVGIGGLAGQGKIGISNGILGIFPAKGEVIFEGKPLQLNNPLKVLEKSVAFVSEDRKNIGLILNESIEQNIAIGALRIKGSFLKKIGPFTQIDTLARRENARKMIDAFQIKCVSETQHVGDLSGGNQQKVCLAKALTMNPDLLFVSEPTRGIDIGAKQTILEHLLYLNREKGVTIVITSSELKELRTVCDRIAIVTDGQLAGILAPDAPDMDFGLMMSGVTGSGKLNGGV